MADATIEERDRRGFFTRWFMSTNKDIGVLYLVPAATAGLIAVVLSMMMRLELMEPGVQHMCFEGLRILSRGECAPNGHVYNVIVTAHGILMMFFVVIPALFGGLGNTSCRCTSARRTWRFRVFLEWTLPSPPPEHTFETLPRREDWMPRHESKL